MILDNPAHDLSRWIMMNVGTAEGRELEDIIVRLLAAEREACAATAETRIKWLGDLVKNMASDPTSTATRQAYTLRMADARDTAAAIRARGKEGA